MNRKEYYYYIDLSGYEWCDTIDYSKTERQ